MAESISSDDASRDPEAKAVAIRSLTQEISTRLQEEFLFEALERLRLILGADRLAFYYDDGGNGVPRHIVSRTKSGNDEVHVSESILTQATATTDPSLKIRPWLTSDARADVGLARSHSVSMQGVRAALWVPLLRGQGDRLGGWLYADSGSQANVFSQQDLVLVDELMTQLSVDLRSPPTRGLEWRTRTERETIPIHPVATPGASDPSK